MRIDRLFHHLCLPPGHLAINTLLIDDCLPVKDATGVCDQCDYDPYEAHSCQGGQPFADLIGLLHGLP